MNDGFPLKPFKRIVKEHYNNEICEEVFEHFRKILLKIAHDLAEETVREFVQ